jgi:hypothetical protein
LHAAAFLLLKEERLMPRTHEDIGREIDRAEPSPAVRQAVAEDLDAHLPAADIPGQATQEPLKKSQREAQDDESPGS